MFSVKRVALLLVMALVAVLGAGVVATPAHAVFDLCTVDGSAASPLPELGEWSAPAASRGGASSIGSDAYGATAYEWFGGNPIPFTSTGSFDPEYANPSINSDCASWLTGSYAKGLGGFFSMVWGLGSAMNQVSLWVYQSAQSMEFLSLLVDGVVNPAFEGVGGNEGFMDWYRGALVVVMILAAMWAAVRILQRRSKEAITGLAWHLVFAVLGLLLLANPGLVSGIVTVSYQTLSGALASSTNNIAANIVGASSQSNLCELDENIDYSVGPKTGRQQKAVRESTCRMWLATYLEPWSRGQFGTSNPIATDGITAEGAQDVERWSAADQNRNIAVEIPGLSRQPDPGSLVALQLSALRVSPREQRWLDARESAAGEPKWVGLSQLRGGEDLEGNLNFEKSGYLYPGVMKTRNACPADGECIVNTGHQQTWQVLTDRATGHGDPGIASTWGGVSQMASDARLNGTMLMFTGTAVLGGVSAFFGATMLVYQLLLGVMILFMGFALLGMAIPGIGTQVARDFFARIIEYVIMLTVVAAFLPVTVVLMTYIPDLILPDVSVSQMQGGIGNVVIRNTISLIVGVVMIVMFFKLRKSLRGRQYIKGARANSAWDVGGRVADSVSKAATTAVVLGGVAAAVVVTGGVAAAIGAATVGKGAKGSIDERAAESGESTMKAISAEPGSAPKPVVFPPVSGPSAPSKGGAVSQAVSPVVAGVPSTNERSARTAGTAAAVGFWATFGTSLVSQMKNFSSNAAAALMSGGGLDSVIHGARSTLTEMATGRQVKKIVTDARGRQTVLETGVDSSEADRRGAGAPYSPAAGGIDAQQMFEAVYAGMVAAGVDGGGRGRNESAPEAPQGILCAKCNGPIRNCSCNA